MGDLEIVAPAAVLTELTEKALASPWMTDFQNYKHCGTPSSDSFSEAICAGLEAIATGEVAVAQPTEFEIEAYALKYGVTIEEIREFVNEQQSRRQQWAIEIWDARQGR